MKTSVLLVDDREANLDVLEAMLQGLELETVRVASGAEALIAAAEREPAVVLLDVQMPGMDGFETAKGLRRIEGCAHVPVIFVTAAGLADERYGYELGAVDYLVKPVDIHALRSKIAVFVSLFEQRQQVVQQALELARASRLKSEFLANMSHELRTPLNAIIGFAQLMHSGKVGAVSESHHEYLGDILTSSRHLAQLINDVLDLARVESGKLEFRPESVDLAALIDETLEVLRVSASEKGLTVEVEIPKDLGQVQADPTRLKQILYNYLSNALKFTSRGGHVAVRVLPDGSESFRVEVKDDGIGIAADDQKRLFQEFQQLDAGAAKKYQGTGLGLALTRRIAEAQGGRVGVESATGQGSTFWAVLPRFAAPGDIGAGPSSRPGSNVRPILVVEDDPHDRALILRAVEGAGYSVMAAANARSAVALAQKNQFAAVMLDLLLPDASGWDVLDAIRATSGNANVPVVVVSGAKDGSIGRAYRIDDFLVKPVERTDLLSSLERVGIHPPSGQSILVVDDDEAMLRLMSATVSGIGCRPICAPNVEQGLESLAEDPPSAIILDLVMPGANGFDFLERLRSLPHGCDVPVIVWTSKDLSPDEQALLRSSASSVVRKEDDATGRLLEELAQVIDNPTRSACFEEPAGGQ